MGKYFQSKTKEAAYSWKLMNLVKIMVPN
jgi:hypothetical protein